MGLFLVNFSFEKKSLRPCISPGLKCCSFYAPFRVITYAIFNLLQRNDVE